MAPGGVEPDVLSILLILLNGLDSLPAGHNLLDSLLLAHTKSKKEETMIEKAYAFSLSMVPKMRWTTWTIRKPEMLCPSLSC